MAGQSQALALGAPIALVLQPRGDILSFGRVKRRWHQLLVVTLATIGRILHLCMLRKAWIEVRSSLWFVPALLVLVAVGMAFGLVELDVALAEELRAQAWRPLLNAGADGARGMLTAIAGSMITIAGVTFSITIVTMSLASSQYSPRILRNFMRDRANQGVLGVFVGIFTYCLLVLRTIRGSDGGPDTFVPLLAVFVAFSSSSSIMLQNPFRSHTS